MCSGLRLVKTAMSKMQASTRPRTSAWLETSMATASTPRSSMTANRAWRSVASGVVRSDLMRSSPMRISTVPIRPVDRTVFRPPSTRYAVVVLPEVPVMPIWSRSRPG
jgi:hypothetical protein